jgi:TRAP-type C4-dicarboxylate transport system permease small subunit
MDFDQSLDLRTASRFDRLVNGFATVVFAFLILLTIVQVVDRTFRLTVPGVPLELADSGARLLLIVGTYIGAAIATRNDEHIVFRPFIDFLERRSQRAYTCLRIGNSLVILGFVLIVLYGVIQTATRNWANNLAGFPVPYGVVYSGIAIGFALLFLYEASNLYEKARSLTGGTDG